MPIYAYKCAECSHQMDVIRKVSDPPLLDCPSCGKPALVKQVTAAGFQLKGAGWYVTDFRDQGSGKKKDGAKPDEKATTDQPADSKTDSKTEAKSDAGADAKAAAKSDTKTESKTESKSESKTESGSKSAPAPAGPPAPKGTSSGSG
ncbi:MAG: FmdB family zinc ribbon protein [Burkholderiaceae bacterium]